jgi:hypothetical protein
MDYRSYISELSNNKLVIYNLIKDLTPPLASWKPDTDRWSVLETLSHIIDIEIEDFRYDLNMILFTPEEEWPHFDEMLWVTSREYNKRSFFEMLDKFMRERDKTITWLEELKNPDLNARHSGKGFKSDPKSAGDILVSWAAHDLFHIRQLALLNYDILDEFSKPFSPSYSGFYK